MCKCLKRINNIQTVLTDLEFISHFVAPFPFPCMYVCMYVCG